MFPFIYLTCSARTIIVRPAEASDRSSIVSNINAIAAEEVYLQTGHFASSPAWEAAFHNSCDPAEGRLLVVAVNSWQLVGHLRLFPGSYGAKDRHVASVGLAVLAAYRGMGIGAALLQTALAWAPQAAFEKMEANVVSSNERSLRLFSRLGFGVEGIKRRQLRVGGQFVDEIIMARPVYSLLPEAGITGDEKRWASEGQHEND